MMYIYLMQNIKPLNPQLVQAHVHHLEQLDKQGKLVLCGPFTDYPGGMVVITADSLDEAVGIAKADPFIASGCKTYEVRTLQPANQANQYLL